MRARLTAASGLRPGTPAARSWGLTVLAGLVVTVVAGCGPAPSPVVAGAVTTTYASPVPVGPPSPSPSSTARGEAPPMAASRPVRVLVPAIGVDSELMDLGLNADGTLEVPPGPFPAGWYTGSPTPGELGPAVLAGHVDWNDEYGVFHDLAALEAGDVVTVVREDASEATFRVVAVREYPKDQFPTAAVYGDTVGPELRLITCGGDLDAETGHYVDNVVAFAVLEPAPPSP